MTMSSRKSMSKEQLLDLVVELEKQIKELEAELEKAKIASSIKAGVIGYGGQRNEKA